MPPGFCDWMVRRTSDTTGGPQLQSINLERSFIFHLGGPVFVCFWQRWDLARRINPSLWFLEVVVMDESHFSQKRREMGHPDGDVWHNACFTCAVSITYAHHDDSLLFNFSVEPVVARTCPLQVPYRGRARDLRQKLRKHRRR